jgi:hypothetical protein
MFPTAASWAAPEGPEVCEFRDVTLPDVRVATHSAVAMICSVRAGYAGVS